jgi:hypothetical protein
MSVVSTTKDLLLPSGWSECKCILCDGRLFPPFLYWHGSSLFICGKCCQQNKNGLMADLIHAAAAKDLRDLGYPEITLDRRSVKSVEREIEKQVEMDRQGLESLRAWQEKRATKKPC